MRIGLTGGIAAGKSTVSARLRELGALVVDYDELAHRVVAPGGAALPAIVAEFGPDALKEDGTLDRAWMAAHVFGAAAEPGARERLGAIEHPLIYAEAAEIERAAQPGQMIVHDVPLLAEVLAKGEIPFAFDHIVTVEAPEAVRIARMTADRGMSEDQARARIFSQSTQAEREAIADTVLTSDRPKSETRAAIDALYRQWADSLSFRSK